MVATKQTRIMDTDSPTDRTGSCETTKDTGSLVGGEFDFLTLADAEQAEKNAWTALNEVIDELNKTELGQRVVTLRSEWSEKRNLVEMLRKAKTMGLSVAAGCSRRAVLSGQADHLRQAVAAGVMPTANEAY